MRCRPLVLALLVAAGVLAAGARASADTTFPAGIPDLRDPEIRSRFMLLNLARLDDDPDFPVLMLAGVGAGSPALLVVIVDARNGKETWSLREDAAVFYLMLADPTTVERAFLDEGFAASGKASGRFTAAGPGAAENLMARLRESHGRTRRTARLGPAI